MGMMRDNAVGCDVSTANGDSGGVSLRKIIKFPRFGREKYPFADTDVEDSYRVIATRLFFTNFEYAISSSSE